MNPLDRPSIPLSPSRPVHARPALSTIAACLALLGAAWPAQAQDGAAPAQATPGGNLPDVTVTGAPVGSLGLALPSTSGSRTGIATQELPASLDSVDSETWQEQGKTDLVDIIDGTVGMMSMSAPGNGGLSFSTRGFTGVNSVGIAEDGVRLGVASGTVSYPRNAWGYERVEVLRGPASIVYGSGTAGGTVNMVRKQPSRTPAREAMLGAGSHGTGQLGIGLTGPIGETLSYRIDAYGRYSSGERDLGRDSSAKLMTTLRMQPSSAVRLELLADIADDKPERYFGTPTLNGQVLRELRKENYNTEDSVVHYKERRLRARGSWQVNDWLTLRDEAYHFRSDRHWKNIEAYAYNPGDDTVARSDYLEIGHDLKQSGNRLEGTATLGQHKLAAGWEVARAEIVHSNNSPYGGSSTVTALNPVHGLWSSPDPTTPGFGSRLTSHDFYLEDAWRPTDRWLLLAGIRRDLNKVARREFRGAQPFDQSLGGTAWRLGASYSINAGTNVYAQWSQGHDPVTNLLTLNLANRDYRLTRARQLEVGVKQQLAGGLAEWTAALYRIEKTDIITRDPDHPTLSVQGGAQRSHGLELSGVLRPHANWRLEGNYAFTDAKFIRLIEGNAGLDRSGNRPANVPRHSANLWAHYTTDSGVGRWQASLGARMVGARYANNANTARTGGHTVWDAALAWRPRRDTTLRLVVRNLGDKVYTHTAISGSQAILGEGRRFDLSADFAF